MFLKKVLVGFAVLAMGIASAASDYKVELSQATQVGGTELKPGAYRVEIQGDKAVFKSGKTIAAQAPATVENGKQKYSETSVSTKASKIESISIGGSTMKIVFAP